MHGSCRQKPPGRRRPSGRSGRDWRIDRAGPSKPFGRSMTTTGVFRLLSSSRTSAVDRWSSSSGSPMRIISSAGSSARKLHNDGGGVSAERLIRGEGRAFHGFRMRADRAAASLEHDPSPGKSTFRRLRVPDNRLVARQAGVRFPRRVAELHGQTKYDRSTWGNALSHPG
jgi:hypothetical protein